MSPTRRLPLAAAMVVVTSLAFVGTAFATETVTTRRLAGDNRYETAAAIAQATFPSGARVAVLASGEGFADALAASYMAGRLDAPLLLTAQAGLSTATESQLKGMNVSGVTIVGGNVAVSEAVATRLRDLGYTVDRVSGGDRYATARAIAELFPSDFVGSLGDGGRTAIVASGAKFPDALAGAPISYSASFPVLLTPAATLARDTSAAFSKLGIEQVVLLGGPAAVSDSVEQSIRNRGITVIRLFGDNRQETAAQVADFAVTTLGWSAAHVNLARGDDFADALAGGPHEGVEKAPVLLTLSPTQLGATASQWLRAHQDTVASIDVFGGRQAISDPVVEEARVAATTS